MFCRDSEMDSEDVWRKQQALEKQSMTQVMTTQLQPWGDGTKAGGKGDNVCVWDAFGAFWCEPNKPVGARRTAAGPSAVASQTGWQVEGVVPIR